VLAARSGIALTISSSKEFIFPADWDIASLSGAIWRRMTANEQAIAAFYLAARSMQAC
jgi:hypothetical protein